MILLRRWLSRFSICVLFFFQAEDGIRDLVRSRGLGDVYKRQVLYRTNPSGSSWIGVNSIFSNNNPGSVAYPLKIAVSYTHLTLPTSDLV